MKIKAKLLGTRSKISHRPIVVEFITYVPKTDVKHAASRLPNEFRGVK